MAVADNMRLRAFAALLVVSGICIAWLELGHSFLPHDEEVISAPLAATNSSAVLGSASSSAFPAERASSQRQSDHSHSIRIAVPFASQAPTGDWNDPYQEACEEASLLLVHHYLSGTPLSNGVMQREILSLVQAEAEQFGFGHDVIIDDLASVAREHFGYRTEVIHDFTIEDMKQVLAQGYPIIVPLAGRRLGNPYYSGEGPWYHMLVITGFTGTQFITNDVGTKRGAGYRYDFHRLYDNIHDWTGVKEDIEKGQKVMLIVKK